MRRMLLNAGSVVLAASTIAVGFGATAFAQEVEVSGNVALVSDYRFRGASLSDESPAIQGGFDIALPSGLYVGTWASSIETYTEDPASGGSEIEMDLYGGYGFEAGMFTFDAGAIGYFYPGSEDLEYYEVYGSGGTTLGIMDLTLGFAWAPEQDNLGDEDNMYYYLDGALPLGDSAFSLTGHVGYEDGSLADAVIEAPGVDDKTDWSIGIATSVMGVDVGLSYVDTSEDGDDTEGTAVLSVSKAL